MFGRLLCLYLDTSCAGPSPHLQFSLFGFEPRIPFCLLNCELDLSILTEYVCCGWQGLRDHVLSVPHNFARFSLLSMEDDKVCFIAC